MRGFMKAALLGVFILGSFSSPALANEDGFYPQTFTAKVGDVRLQSELVAQGKSSEDVVTVTERVRLFSPPFSVADVRSVTHPTLFPEIDFLIEYTKANIEGDVQKIAEFWSPDERAEVMEKMANPDMLARNTEYFKNNLGLEIVGIVEQRATRSVLRKIGNGALGVNVVRKDDRLYLTNKPEDDLSLAIIEAAFFHH